jgi:hypothetical protein
MDFLIAEGSFVPFTVIYWRWREYDLKCANAEDQCGEH